MVYFNFIQLLTILCIINTTIAFKCWCCSSDESDSAFCGQFLDESNLTRYQKAVNLVDCTYPHFDKGPGLITKCMIQRTINKGETVYARSCVWEDINAKKDDCKFSHAPPYGHRVEACETCVEDKCNYKMVSDHNGGSALLKTLCHIVFIMFGIVLII